MIFTALKRIRKLLITFVLKLRTNFYKFKLFISGQNVVIGNNVELGHRVKLKTTAGGRIIIGNYVGIGNDSCIEAAKGIIKIDDHSFVGEYAQIVSRKKILIGQDCLIARLCTIVDSNHRYDERGTLIRLQGDKTETITIAEDIWIGTQVVVTAGVSIGRGSVIGAHAVVCTNIPEFSVAVGVPAKVIKKRG